MAKLYVSEYSLPSQLGPFVAHEPPIAEQVVSYTGTAGASSAFSSATNFIRVHTDGICSIQVGSNPTATTSMKRLVAGQTEYYSIDPGNKISAIVNT